MIENGSYYSDWLDVIDELAVEVTTWPEAKQLHIVALLGNYLQGAYERVAAERARGDVAAYRRVLEYLHGQAGPHYRAQPLSADLRRLEAVLEGAETESDSLLLPLSIPLLTWFEDIAEGAADRTADEVLVGWKNILEAPLEAVSAAVSLHRDRSDSNAERAAVDAHPRMIRTLADIQEIVGFARASAVTADTDTVRRGDIFDGLDIRDPAERLD